MSDRQTLKSFFRTGAIPREADFADLIDSVVNIEEDGWTSSREPQPAVLPANGTWRTLSVGRTSDKVFANCCIYRIVALYRKVDKQIYRMEVFTVGHCLGKRSYHYIKPLWKRRWWKPAYIRMRWHATSEGILLQIRGRRGKQAEIVYFIEPLWQMPASI
jgi:hypothetical protein